MLCLFQLLEHKFQDVGRKHNSLDEIDLFCMRHKIKESYLLLLLQIQFFQNV